MQPKRLAAKIKEAALDKKAEDVVVLDIAKLTSIARYFVIMHGNSDVHVKAIANNVVLTMKAEEGTRALQVEGIQNGQWAVVDYGSVIVHIFYREMREFYALERLWGDAPVIE